MRKTCACIVAVVCVAGLCSLFGCEERTEDDGKAQEPETQSEHDKNLEKVMINVSCIDRSNVEWGDRS